MRKFYLIIIVSILIISTSLNVIGAENEKEEEFEDDEFEFHCALGVVGIILVLSNFLTGFLLSDRFGRIKNLKPIPIHKFSTIIMALFFTGQSVYGFLILRWFFIPNFHGYLGLFIPIVAWLNIGFSPCVAKRIIKWKNASIIHAFFAIILLALVILQVLYGYLFLDV